jgi:hypothetical protein
VLALLVLVPPVPIEVMPCNAYAEEAVAEAIVSATDCGSITAAIAWTLSLVGTLLTLSLVGTLVTLTLVGVVLTLTGVSVVISAANLLPASGTGLVFMMFNEPLAIVTLPVVSAARLTLLVVLINTPAG